MSRDQEVVNSPSASPASGFVWHPVHAGNSFEQVKRELALDIERDQRSYQLAMEGAEASEAGSLVLIVDLERRWSAYEFDWANMDPNVLAARILAFEQVREERKDMIDFSDYRASGGLVETAQPAASATMTSLPVMKIGAILLVLLIIVFIVAVIL